MNPHDLAHQKAPAKYTRLRLAALFGTLYFIQGMAEPTEGLIAQPVRSLLERWGHTADDIGRFMFLLAVPWFLKPLYGLLTDFVPLFGMRRKSYLIVMSAVAAAALLCLYALRIPDRATTFLLLILVAPTLAIAFSDVVTDALLVEKGQATGTTGQLQSAQWTAIYGAAILTGTVGGLLSQHNQQQVGFLICGALLVVTCILTVVCIREQASTERPSIRVAGGQFKQALGSPGILPIVGFLALWNFNPYANATLDFHMTRALGFDEQFYGTTISMMAAAMTIASMLYGLYCRRLPVRALLHLSVLLGIISTLSYWGLTSTKASAIAVAVVVGFAYMTGTLIQLDLAARICPAHLAGTIFAVLMSISNFSLSLSVWLGGVIYTQIEGSSGPESAFRLLVGIGAVCTAACWLLVPSLARAATRSSEQTSIAV